MVLQHSDSLSSIALASRTVARSCPHRPRPSLKCDNASVLMASRLGVMHAYGSGVPQDEIEAAVWYRRSAEQGYASAQSILGEIYATGQGVTQDDSEAVAWYRLAVAQGHAGAQFGLGWMYAEGRGVPQDFAEAIAWYRLAAEQGYASAQYNLGVMYATGQGVPQDNVEAHMWLNLAASRSSAADREQLVATRDRVAERMTPADLSETQRRAREWHAAHQLP